MTPIHTLDLEFMGVERLIGCFAARCPDGGFALLECGPSSTLDALERSAGDVGLSLDGLRAVCVTHVHLDHSGAAGTLARRTGARVLVHPEGERHLLDPSAKLLPSAERLYGEMMEPLWGRVEAVPEGLVETIGDGETVEVDGLEVTGWHTPGHAVHHVAWQVGDAIATGDVAGVRFAPSTHVLPPMPPPDIDLDAWHSSLDLLRKLDPAQLLLTHFGAFDDGSRHLDELADRIDRWREIAERTVSDGGDRDTLADALLELDRRQLEDAGAAPDIVERYRRLCPMDGNSAGLYRACAPRPE